MVKCPQCGSEPDIDSIDVEPWGEDSYVESLECSECECEWVRIFEYSRMEVS